MGAWHQDLVVKGVPEEEVDTVVKKILDYLQLTKIVSTKPTDGSLGQGTQYGPGVNWKSAVEISDEDHFLDLSSNSLEIQTGRTVFYADGREFDSIACPNCGENNLECDWSTLFSQWIQDPTTADWQCKNCGTSNAISEYQFEPKWALGNLGFTFWNWPRLNDAFIERLEVLVGKKIEKVEGKI